jgi:hypothetical protein
MDAQSAELDRREERPPARPPLRQERIIGEAIRGSLGWAVTGAVFGAALGWTRGGVALGVAAGGGAAVAGAMIGWVLGTGVGLADHWPLSRMFVRVLGGTFLGAVFGLHLVKEMPNVPEARQDLIALLWALAGALVGLSTSIKSLRPRADRATKPGRIEGESE